MLTILRLHITINQKHNYTSMKLELTVPSNLSEITLQQYQKFIACKVDTNDNVMLTEKMVQIFCDIELKDIVKIKLADIQSLVDHFNKLFTEKPKFKTTFKIRHIEFGFIPDLENISFGEYVDLEENLKDWKTYHKAMAVLYRPIKAKYKDTYEIYNYTGTKEYADLMKFAPLDVVLSSSVFFWSLGNELLTATLHYLETQVKKNPKIIEILAKQHNFLNNGGGINQFMHSLRETLETSTTLPDWELISV